MSESSARKKVNFAKSIETYNMISDAAEALIEESGISVFNIQDLAKKSGYGVGTIYLYFDDKESLFEGLVRRHVLNIFQKFQESVGPQLPLPPEELLYNLILLFLKDKKSKILAELFGMVSVLESQKNGVQVLSLILTNLERELKETLKIQLDKESIEKKSVILLHLLRGMFSVQSDKMRSSAGKNIFLSDEEYAKWLTEFSISFLRQQ